MVAFSNMHEFALDDHHISRKLASTREDVEACCLVTATLFDDYLWKCSFPEERRSR